ncbi:MAG: hypothetical protein HKN21_03235, partial [Candidatus Eisenbacteria bacterium]|nr:hypothetical protein [Candidatus Eisenbacteria bacterium]
MKRQPIPFKRLLETVLPVEKLSAREQSRLSAVLDEGIPTEIEAAAMEAIDHLTDLGHLRLVEETPEEAGTRRRYQNLLTTDSIVIHIPDAVQDQTVHIPLPLRDWKRATSLDEVRSLFHLYNKMITKDSQLLRAPSDMLRQLLLTTRDLMGCESVTFWSALPGEEAASSLGDLNSPVYDETQAREWVLDRRYLVHFPDLPAQIDPETQGLDDRFRSMAMVPVGSPAVGIYGVLQA